MKNIMKEDSICYEIPRETYHPTDGFRWPLAPRFWRKQKRMFLKRTEKHLHFAVCVGKHCGRGESRKANLNSERKVCSFISRKKERKCSFDTALSNWHGNCNPVWMLNLCTLFPSRRLMYVKMTHVSMPADIYLLCGKMITGGSGAAFIVLACNWTRKLF